MRNITGMIMAGVIPSSFVFAQSLSAISPERPMICVFTRVFDFLGYDMFKLFSEVGFVGVDLTVRKGGFVSPDRVEKDLLKAVSNADKEKLTIPMIATGITDVKDLYTERILKTASELGIKHYRMGYFQYDNALSIQQNLDVFKSKMLDLSELNEKYGIQGNYQNHVGGMFGSAIWDLWEVIKDLNPKYVACQYDVRHAAAEGFTSWVSALKAIAPYIGTLCIKDFIYEKSNSGWTVTSVPLTTGVVDFKKYTDILCDNKLSVPISYHPEFSLYNQADKSLSNKEKMRQMLPVLKKELQTILSIFS